MVQCGICLEEYQEGDLELHRQMCEVRLMFRCSLCDGDYVNKEGLWNHLDLHAIADEIKEQHYQEIKAKHKLHQCVLCNDQRAYSEISYWKHVHDVHDGFFLRCSDCGENFRSEKLKNDHASSHCKTRDPIEEQQVPIEDGNMTADTECLKLWLGDQSTNTIGGHVHRLSIDYAGKNICDKESKLPPINLPSRFPCDICGKSFSTKGARLRHKAAKYACSSSSSPGTKCFHCNKKFISSVSLQNHIFHCHQPTKCGICGITFESYSVARYHKRRAHAETQKHTAKNDSSSHKSSNELIMKDRSDPKEAVEKNHEHTKRYHPDESSLESIPIVQDQKQAQNIDLKMEITVEETTISARDDQGLSSVNPCSDVLNSRSNEQSSAYLNEDAIMDSPVIDKESQTVSVAPLNCSSKRNVVSEEISQPLDENLSNQPYVSNISGITMHQYSQFKHHRATKHRERRHQCPFCSRKFHIKMRLEKHASCCASLKHSCELCGQKFNLRSGVEDHKKRAHHGSTPLRDVEKIDAAEEMASCIVCRISYGSTDELKKHKLNCPKHSKEHDDSQFSTENIPLLHGVSEAQADSTIIAQGEIIDVKLEIEVEETLLQEQDFQVPNQNPERSSATTLLPDGDKSKHVESEDADDLENGIKVKEECLEGGEETIAEHQTGTISNQKTDAEVIRPAYLIDLGYVPVKSCSFEDAKLFVKNFEFGFGFYSERINKKGSMRYYSCLRFKRSVRPQCERKVLMFTPNDNEKSTVCVKGEHSCINAPPENMVGHAKKSDLDYAPVKKCSFKDAKSFVKKFEFGFRYVRRVNSGKTGNKKYYRCSRIKSTAWLQCERKVLICTPNKNEESTVCAKGEHSCKNAPPENLTDVGIDLVYAPVKTCSFEDAKSFLKNFEFGFRSMLKKNGEKGNMRYYRCSRIKSTVRPQCERKVFICTPNTNEESTVYAKGKHSCMNAPPENLTDAQIDFGYAPVKTCSFEDAKSYVKNFEFGFRYAKGGENGGNKRFYRCSRIKATAHPQCERKVLICTPNKNEESTVCAKGKHSCINAPPENLTRVETGFGYTIVKMCSFEDAKSFVKYFEFGFRSMLKKNGEKGNMRFYRCSRIKSTVRPQCERKVFICTPNKNEESTVYAKGEHSCINAPPEHLTDVQIDFGYAPVKTCSFEDAKSFVKNFEFGFRYAMGGENGGNKRFYRCSRIKSTARPQCKRKVCICTPNTNEESTVCAKGEHSCINAPPENLTRVKAKPSVEQSDITIKSGVPKKDVKNHAMLLRTSVSKNRQHT